jgi:hypothetical protein
VGKYANVAFLSDILNRKLSEKDLDERSGIEESCGVHFAKIPLLPHTQVIQNSLAKVSI